MFLSLQSFFVALYLWNTKKCTKGNYLLFVSSLICQSVSTSVFTPECLFVHSCVYMSSRTSICSFTVWSVERSSFLRVSVSPLEILVEIVSQHLQVAKVDNWLHTCFTGLYHTDLHVCRTLNVWRLPCRKRFLNAMILLTPPAITSHIFKRYIYHVYAFVIYHNYIRFVQLVLAIFF